MYDVHPPLNQKQEQTARPQQQAQPPRQQTEAPRQQAQPKQEDKHQDNKKDQQH
jgi:hypothetical protein